MKEICQILNIENFSTDNVCILKKDNHLCLLSDDFQFVKIADGVYDFIINKGYIYFQHDNLTSIYQYNIENKSILQLNGQFIISMIFGHNLFYIYGMDSENIDSIFSINKKTLLIENVIPYTQGLLVLETKDNEILYRGKYLFCKNMLKDRNVWQIELNGLKVFGDIHKYNNVLVVPLNNNHLLGINAQTGEKLWELEDCFNYYNLDENTGLLYGYARDFFEIVDVIKGEKTVEKRFVDSMDKYQISPDQNMNVLAGDALYFVSNWKGSTKLGKVNIRSQEIEFVQELGVEEGVKTQAPVYHNGRLYILDSVGTLHIFE